MIYLDNAATTEMAHEVFESMVPYMQSEFGNPASKYSLGKKSKDAIDEARQRAAKLISADAEEIIFTSGASESNSLIIRGLERYLISKGKSTIITTKVEHDSVLNSINSLDKNMFSIKYIPVHSDGSISVKDLEEMINDDVGLVSIMYVNNELGNEYPIEEIGALCNKHEVLFHTDLTQAVGSNKIDVKNIGCDFASFSSHKIDGPKGVGAAYVKDKTKLKPLICGGHQEYNVRAGTENVAGIVGFGTACKIADEQINERIIQTSILKQKFYTTLISRLKEKGFDDIIKVNGQPVINPGKILNLTIRGIDNESLILMMDQHGVCISAGSACNGLSAVPSHVLTSIGLSLDDARSTVRISFSHRQDVKDIIDAAKIMANCIEELKGISL